MALKIVSGIEVTNITLSSYLDLAKNELRNATIQNLSTTQINAISSPSSGQIAYDSTVNKLKFYNGSAWGDISGGTVTSIGITAGAGTTVSGSPVTTSGSITVGVDGVLEDLDTLGAAASDGQFIVATGAGAFAYESGATVRTSLGLGSAATAASGDFLAADNNLSDIPDLSQAKTNLELGALADLNSVNASTIADNSVNIAELNVTDGSNGQVLTTNGSGTLSFTNKTTNTDTDVSVGNLTSRLEEITENVTIGDAVDVTVTTAGDLTVTGDLTVSGTTTTVNSTTVTIDDPIFTLGGDTAPGSDDNKDRGLEFRYHNGSAAKLGFFGYDDSTGYFTFIPDATNSSEVFSGTQGTIDVANIRLDNSGLILNGTAVTATAAELNYVDGVTSAIQTQLDGKQATITGAATTIDDADLTASRALVSNSSGKVAVSAVTSTELGYLDGVTSAIQTQLNGKTTAYSGSVTVSSGTATIASSTHGLTFPANVQLYDENNQLVLADIRQTVSGGEMTITVNAADADYSIIAIGSVA